MPIRYNTSVITNAELRKIREQIAGRKQNQSQVQTVNRSELARIKREMTIMSQAEIAA